MANLNEKSYWIVTGEWMEIVQTGSAIATPENPTPNQQVRPIQRKASEYIDVHPSMYLLRMVNERPMYVMVHALQINRKMFEYATGFIMAMRAAANGGVGAPPALAPDDNAILDDDVEGVDTPSTGEQTENNVITTED